MKKPLLLLVILMFIQNITAQTKIDEFGAMPYDDITSRLENAHQLVRDNPKQQAYFVIYKPKNTPTGKFARHFYGIQNFWVKFLRFPSSQIEMAAGEEREELLTQIWQIDENLKVPDVKTISLREKITEKIKEKTLFDSDCIVCEPDPSVPLSLFYGDGLKFYAEALKANPQTQALIQMRKNYRIKVMRDKLIKDYGIEAKRIKFQIKKSLPGASDARFYIVPI